MQELVHTATQQKLVAAYLAELIYSLEVIEQSNSGWFLFGAFTLKPIIDELNVQIGLLNTGRMNFVSKMRLDIVTEKANDIIHFVELLKCSARPHEPGCFL